MTAEHNDFIYYKLLRNGHNLTVIDIKHIWIISYIHVDKEGKIYIAHLTSQQSAESEGEIMRSKI